MRTLLVLLFGVSAVGKLRHVGGGEIGSWTSRAIGGWRETLSGEVGADGAAGVDLGDVRGGTRAGTVQGVHRRTEEFFVGVGGAVGGVLGDPRW